MKLPAALESHRIDRLIERLQSYAADRFDPLPSDLAADIEWSLNIVVDDCWPYNKTSREVDALLLEVGHILSMVRSCDNDCDTCCEECWDIAKYRYEVDRLAELLKGAARILLEDAYIDKQIVGSESGRKSGRARRKRPPTKLRNEEIIGSARDMLGRHSPRSYILSKLANDHGLSQRQIRRILKNSGII
jgi:hypothetical protein